MKKRLVSFLSIILILLGFFIFFQVIINFLPKGRGALQVTSNVKAKILLNGKNVGTTPVCLCSQDERIDEGNYTLQLVPEGNVDTYTTKIKIGKDVLTAVDRTFLPGSYASTSTLYLQSIGGQTANLFVSSVPSEALVTVDGTDSGTTPLLLQNLSASEHEIELQKGGYGKKTIRIRTVPGYKLIVEAVLGTTPSTGETLPGSAPTPTPTPSVPATPKVIIGSTPTGFLRVRKEASISSAEIGQVKPGDTLPMLAEQNGWYNIQLPNGATGWISANFATKVETPSITPVTQ
ncbi:MAG: PEGA domain-containing protein [Candidatus Levyibacteriota bacterium]